MADPAANAAEPKDENIKPIIKTPSNGGAVIKAIPGVLQGGPANTNIESVSAAGSPGVKAKRERDGNIIKVEIPAEIKLAPEEIQNLTNKGWTDDTAKGGWTDDTAAAIAPALAAIAAIPATAAANADQETPQEESNIPEKTESDAQPKENPAEKPQPPQTGEQPSNQPSASTPATPAESEPSQTTQPAGIENKGEEKPEEPSAETPLVNARHGEVRRQLRKKREPRQTQPTPPADAAPPAGAEPPKIDQSQPATKGQPPTSSTTPPKVGELPAPTGQTAPSPLNKIESADGQRAVADNMKSQQAQEAQKRKKQPFTERLGQGARNAAAQPINEAAAPIVAIARRGQINRIKEKISATLKKLKDAKKKLKNKEKELGPLKNEQRIARMADMIKDLGVSIGAGFAEGLTFIGIVATVCWHWTFNILRILVLYLALNYNGILSTQFEKKVKEKQAEVDKVKDEIKKIGKQSQDGFQELARAKSLIPNQNSQSEKSEQSEQEPEEPESEQQAA